LRSDGSDLDKLCGVMDHHHEYPISRFNPIWVVRWILRVRLCVGVLPGVVRRGLVFKDFLNSRHRASPAGVQVSDLHSVLVSLLLDLHSAGAAAAWTLGHFNLTCTPVDLRVMLTEPGVSKYHILVAKTGHGKVSLL
jgi:hypothetical protein